MKAIVCLPTRNEAESIANMIESIQGIGMEVFVSDADSTDGTQEIARKKGVEVFQRKKGLGKGYGIQEALHISANKGYDVMILIDCDNTYPVSAIPKLVHFSAEFDLVMGARDFSKITWLRRLANIIHTQMINLLYGRQFKDINTGLRALNVKAFLDLLSAPHFDIEAQIVCRASKGGLKIKDIPISYGERTGESKANVMDVAHIVWRILWERLTP